jgi:hypothetical protein
LEQHSRNLKRELTTKSAKDTKGGEPFFAHFAIFVVDYQTRMSSVHLKTAQENKKLTDSSTDGILCFALQLILSE